uniref:aminotransferase class V-fold PLP-dependent enzyme n=1 Tax=Clostridioides difficile TaxID=1496 RepID=UPI001F2F78D4
EIGTIQPIGEVGKYLKGLKEKIYFHVDAIQSYGKINFRPSKYNIDFMSVSAHKFHGPKGIGFMYIKENNRLKPMLTGGGQEIGIRSGTENVPGIYGLGEAVRILNKDLDAVISKVNNLKNILKNEIIDNIEEITSNYDLKGERFASMACRSAIKANDKIYDIEIKSLLEQLEKCENPFTCPHGRPIMVEISKTEIEKMFKRIM